MLANSSRTSGQPVNNKERTTWSQRQAEREQGSSRGAAGVEEEAQRPTQAEVEPLESRSHPSGGELSTTPSATSQSYLVP